MFVKFKKEGCRRNVSIMQHRYLAQNIHTFFGCFKSYKLYFKQYLDQKIDLKKRYFFFNDYTKNRWNRLNSKYVFILWYRYLFRLNRIFSIDCDLWYFFERFQELWIHWKNYTWSLNLNLKLKSFVWKRIMRRCNILKINIYFESTRPKINQVNYFPY